MSRKRKALVLFALGVALLLPSFTYVAAQGSFSEPTSGGGLVPCGVTVSSFGGGEVSDEQIKTATECQACNLVELTQNIINFLIGLAIGLAVCLFAWAGILYFTSAANVKNVEKGKRVFSNTLIGFLVALCGWLLINTVLYVLIDKEKYPESTWFEISCVSDQYRIRTGASFSDIIRDAIVVAPAPVGAVFHLPASEGRDAGVYTCGAADFKWEASTQMCVNAEGQHAAPVVYVPPAGGAAADASLPFGFCGNGTAAGILACAAYYAEHEVDSSQCSPYVDGGNLACACMVNRILYAAGFAHPIDGDSVLQMRQQLDAGRGKRIPLGQAQPGDIVIWFNGAGVEKHVGICADVGCTSVYSNSSSQHYVRSHAINALGYPTWTFYRVMN